MSHDRPQSAGVQKEGDTGSSRQAMTCFTPGSKKMVSSLPITAMASANQVIEMSLNPLTRGTFMLPELQDLWWHSTGYGNQMDRPSCHKCTLTNEDTVFMTVMLAASAWRSLQEKTIRTP